MNMNIKTAILVDNKVTGSKKMGKLNPLSHFIRG